MSTEAYLLFSLERRRYAIRLCAIDGVDSARAIHAVPGAPPHVLGLAHRRGRLLTVFDLPGIVGHGSHGGSACLLRLADPHAGLALFLPAATSIANLAAPRDRAGSVEWQRQAHRVLIPEELVEAACSPEIPSA